MSNRSDPPASDSWSWDEAITAARLAEAAHASAAPTLTFIAQRSQAGSWPLLCVADNGERYWVKVPGNPQEPLGGAQTLVAETIVSEIAPLLDAPVLRATRVRIPDSWANERYGPDNTYRLRPGVAHASPLLEPAVLRYEELDFLRRDDNSRRVPRLMVFWDWAMGVDPQWLFDEEHSSSIWSFDHGLWLDSAEGPWTIAGLQAVQQSPWELPPRASGKLDAATFYAAADSLERVTRDDLALAVSRVPSEWEGDAGLLGELAATLYARRTSVAQRARALGTHISRGGRR